MKQMQWLDVREGRIVSEDGAEVRLHGVGLGNWLVQEGYMWRFRDGWDRPRRIRELVAVLAGREYAESFWRRFFDTFVTQEDVKRIRDEGFDSVRLPMDASLLMEDTPSKTEFREEGFDLVDRCVRWCREAGLYVILDLHCAPGGQTGSNIDNSVDGSNERPKPRMLTDPARWEQTIALWREIARRYRDEPAVAMYDLLNEPLPRQTEDFEAKREALIGFYRECVAAIRGIDARHLLSIEGAHWATDPETFPESYDPKMVLHIHMYGEIPDERLAERWEPVRRRLQAPVLLGETGENRAEWCAAALWQAERAGFSTNFWCWKKAARHSPYTVVVPEGWEKIAGWTSGGPAPLPDEARRIFDGFLDAIRIENCRYEPEIANAVQRRAPLALRATDFDPGAEASHAVQPRANAWAYRRASGLGIVELDGTTWRHGPGFDSGWEVFGLELREGDWAEYTVHGMRKGAEVEIVGEGAADAEVECSVSGAAPRRFVAAEGRYRVAVPNEGDAVLRVTCTRGVATLREVRFLA